MNEAEKIAYLAGILDGEGHFSLMFYKAEKRYFAIVGVANTSIKLMDWLKNNFGGTVYTKNQPSDKPHWKQRYEWRLYAKAIDIVIPQVIPFLVIKREHAEIIMKLRHSVLCKESITRSDRAIYRHSLFSQLKLLNQRSL